MAHGIECPEIGEEFLRENRHDIDAESPGMLAVILDRLEQLRLGLLAESGKLGGFPLLADPLEILHGGDTELIVERLDFLGAEPLQFKKLEDSLGE